MTVIHFLRFLLILTGISFLSQLAWAQTDTIPVALSGRIAGDETSTRFFIDFDRNVSVQAFYMDAPNRIVIDLNEVNFESFEKEKLVPRGLVSAITLGRISRGRSRIVLHLSGPAEILNASMKQKLDEDSHRFLLDLDATHEERFASLLKKQRDALGKSGDVAKRGDRVQPVQKRDGRFLVVLDPGHGGIDGGAVGLEGTQEKDLVFSFAKILASILESTGPFDVKMTRTEDVFVSLKERLAFNQRAKSDLFISIHADSLSQHHVRGSTIYTLSKKASDRLSEQLAHSENSVDLIAGLALPEKESEVVTDILADLTARETKQFSRRFSGILKDSLERKIKLIKNPQRSAAFGVLKAPEVPSVLIELGYLSNSEDEKLLKTREWQEKAADAVAKAVHVFFKPRMRAER